mgnify:CR=1 FL=1
MKKIILTLLITSGIFALGDIESLEECGLIVVIAQEITDEFDEYLNSLEQAERLNPESREACDSPNSER